MPKQLLGKGFFTWKLNLCENGDPAALALAAKNAGLTHVLIKVADGAVNYLGNVTEKVDRVPAAIDALRAAGIQPWGWQFVYGDKPADEAKVAVLRARNLGLEGFVVNAEGAYSTPAKKAAATRYMTDLRSGLGDIPLALSSYRYPSLHSSFPWKEFLDLCDIAMPQVYWMQAHNPAEQLAKTVREYQTSSRFPSRTVVPTGAAFREHSWQPSLGEIIEFMQAAKSLHLGALNFWEWSGARSAALAGAWDTIRDFPWEDVTVQRDISEQVVAAFNAHDPHKMLTLYSPSAVLVNSMRTVAGHERIRIWYTDLFTNMLPNATFEITGYSGAGNSRHFTWKARSAHHKVDDGNDTIGLLNGKISYHYTFFTVKPV